MLVDFKLYLSEMMMLKLIECLWQIPLKEDHFVDHKLNTVGDLDFLKGNPKILLENTY